MPDSDTANNNTNDAPAPSPFVSDNDLDKEMSAEEEADFVNATLGIKGAKDASTGNDDNSADKDTTADNGDDQNDDNTASDDKSTDSTSDKDEHSEPEPEPDVEEEDNKPATELEAPTTDDLWIEVEQVVLDAEGNESTKFVKLTYDPDNPGSFIPDDFKFKSDKQLHDILTAESEMAQLYRDRLNKYETDKEKTEAAENAAQTEADTKAGWDAEIQDLIEGGFLEQPKVTDPKDPKFMQDPTVSRVDSVFKFMTTENQKRLAEGKPVLRSFGTAFNLYNKQSEQAEAADKKKRDNDLAKARGSLVGGTSASSTGGEAPTYKSGSYHSIQDVPIPD